MKVLKIFEVLKNKEKARIEANRILAEKLQEQEREQFIIEGRAKFLHDTIVAQRKIPPKEKRSSMESKEEVKEEIKEEKYKRKRKQDFADIAEKTMLQQKKYRVYKIRNDKECLDTILCAFKKKLKDCRNMN
ncbi:hypothetical protein Tco_0067129 [Tanacetum coccineum]